MEAAECGKQAEDRQFLDGVSNCSTAPGSPELCPADPVSPPSLVSGAVVIFDWDDTLLPTTAVNMKSSKKQWMPTAALRRHAQLVERTLRSASKIGRVSIVTLSQNGWVYRSAAKYLRGLDFPALVAELGITIYHAFDWATDYEWANEDFVSVKRRAMVRCLKDWRREDADLRFASQMNALSIGDGEAEKWALKGIKGAFAKRAGLGSSRPLCKTVKLMDCPSVEQLGRQLSVLVPGLAALVEANKHFDLNVTSPIQLSSKIYDVR